MKERKKKKLYRQIVCSKFVEFDRYQAVVEIIIIAKVKTSVWRAHVD